MQANIQAWLDEQCRQIDGATGAVVMVLPRNSAALVPAAHWPPGGIPGEGLAAAAKAAYEKRQTLSQPRLNGAERPVPLGPMISCPIEVKGQPVGAVAVGFGPELVAPAQGVVDGIVTGARSFEGYLRKSAGTNKKPASTKSLSPASAGSTSDPTLTQPGPMLAANTSEASGSHPGAAPAAPAPALSAAIPTLNNEVDERTVELPASNSARILQLLATVEAHERFREAATAFATELAIAFGCERVSIGLSGRRHVKVDALSHAIDFGANQGLVRDIGAAMEEAIWQGATLIYPLPEGAQPRVDRAHADLAHRHGSAWIGTVPLVKSGRPCGAITLERTKSNPLGRTELALCENIAALLGPLLEIKRTVDRPWPTKLVGALQEALSPLFGRGHLAVKVGAGTALAVLLAATFIPAEYRVSAPARLEGAVQRILAAPADGYLKQTHVRPGDHVKAGQLVAELADEDLKLEERKAESEVSQLENSYGTALAKQDRSEVAILGAKLEETRAQLALAQARLQRTQVQAPFDGIVITGDLTQSLGAPVKKGEALMTVAPEHDFRVILEVDERDIADVKLGKTGSLALSALPGSTFPIHVNRITPVATAGQGRNYFEVEAKLEAKADQLRPGLLGVGKVEADSRSLLWIWTHRVSNWIRLTLWSWIG